MAWSWWPFGKREAREGADEGKAVGASGSFAAALEGGWGYQTKSGASVSFTSALQVSAFYRGILVIADGIAQLPVEIYRSLPSGRGVEPALDHPLYDMLMHRPSAWQDAPTFFRTVLMHAAGAGNSVSYRNVVNGELRELIPLRPELVTIDIDFLNRVYFDVGFESGGTARLYQEQVFHLAGPSWSPFQGIEPSVVGREALGLAKVTEETHARLHSNGARPGGVLSTESRLDEPQVKLIREQWQSVQGGVENAMKTAILHGGLKWTPLSMTGVDSQHIETRKMQIEEIARFLGVFPIMLGHAGDQAPTFASADAFLEAHVRYTLQPWIKSLRAAIETQLLTRDERRAGYHVRIDSSELLRGSLKDRTEYYKAALGTNSSPGWLKPNEIREDDGWNPDDDPSMDQVWQPATMSPNGDPKPSPGDAAPTMAEAKASTPRTLYVSRKLVNAAEFVAWAKGQGFSSILPADDLHVTVAYSRAPIDWMTVGETWSGDRNGGLVVAAGGPRVVEPIGPDGAVALKFASTDLAWRHVAIRESGASWDWPDYQPHVTITCDAAGVDLAKVEPFRGELRFGPEIFEEVQEG